MVLWGRSHDNSSFEKNFKESRRLISLTLLAAKEKKPNKGKVSELAPNFQWGWGGGQHTASHSTAYFAMTLVCVYNIIGLNRESVVSASVLINLIKECTKKNWSAGLCGTVFILTLEGHCPPLSLGAVAPPTPPPVLPPLWREGRSYWLWERMHQMFDTFRCSACCLHHVIIKIYQITLSHVTYFMSVYKCWLSRLFEKKMVPRAE